MEDDDRSPACAQGPQKPEGAAYAGMQASAAVSPDVVSSAAPASGAGSTDESDTTTASSSSSHQPPDHQGHQGHGMDADLAQGSAEGCLISITSYSASIPVSQIQMHAAASASVYGPICKVTGCASASANLQFIEEKNVNCKLQRDCCKCLTRELFFRRTFKTITVRLNHGIMQNTNLTACIGHAQLF